MKKFLNIFIAIIIFLVGAVVYVNEKSVMTAYKSEKIPDLKDGIKNIGFTCTGLAYDKNEKVFYIGNIGKYYPNDEKFNSTIVKISRDLKSNLGEIKLYEIFEDMEDV